MDRRNGPPVGGSLCRHGLLGRTAYLPLPALPAVYAGRRHHLRPLPSRLRRLVSGSDPPRTGAERLRSQFHALSDGDHRHVAGCRFSLRKTYHGADLLSRLRNHPLLRADGKPDPGNTKSGRSLLLYAAPVPHRSPGRLCFPEKGERHPQYLRQYERHAGNRQRHEHHHAVLLSDPAVSRRHDAWLSAQRGNDWQTVWRSATI